MLRRLSTLLSAASLVLCVATCVLWVRSGLDRAGDHLSRVSGATTADEERRAFVGLWAAAREQRWRLQLTVRDATGAPVRMSNPGWTKNVATVDLVVDEQRLSHRVIDPGNLFLLMRE